MKRDRGRGLRGALLAAACGTIAFSGAAAAQTAGTPAPGADLRQQLSELAANPTSVSALVETGRAALAVGDADAAMGFFTRAAELAPRDVRVKAGLAAATAQAGRPESALVLFSEAVALGAPEAEIAGDRGLAYDLAGQTTRAQQDYTLSLRHRDNPEVRRRLALSLAISGEREAALRLLEPQVRQSDRGAHRARAMVMALSGDISGATNVAQATMPAGAAQAMTPFFSRLASLAPGQMAAAANLGRLSSGGVIRAAGHGRISADPSALAFAGGGSTTSPLLRQRLPVQTASTTAPRRRPGANEVASRSTPQRPARGGAQNAMTATTTLAAATINPAAFAQGAPPFRFPHPHERLALASTTTAAQDRPVDLASADDASEPPAMATAKEDRMRADADVAQMAADTQQPQRPVQLASLQPQTSMPEPAPAPAEDEPDQQESEPADGASANLAAWNRSAPTATPAPRQSAWTASPAPRQSAPPQPAPARTSFSDVVATVSTLSTETPRPTDTQRPAATPTRTARSAQVREEARAATRALNSAPATTRIGSRNATQTASRSAPANAATRTAAGRNARAPANPSRVWVQLGVAPSTTGFNYEIGRMRRAAPELLQSRTPYTAAIGGSRRLLVGPFASDAEARTFIGRLRQKNIPSLAWTSPAGTEVDRLTGGR